MNKPRTMQILFKLLKARRRNQKREVSDFLCPAKMAQAQAQGKTKMSLGKSKGAEAPASRSQGWVRGHVSARARVGSPAVLQRSGEQPTPSMSLR